MTPFVKGRYLMGGVMYVGRAVAWRVCPDIVARDTPSHLRRQLVNTQSTIFYLYLQILDTKKDPAGVVKIYKS